jgi:hypothetical protein
MERTVKRSFQSKDTENMLWGFLTSSFSLNDVFETKHFFLHISPQFLEVKFYKQNYSFQTHLTKEVSLKSECQTSLKDKMYHSQENLESAEKENTREYSWN